MSLRKEKQSSGKCRRGVPRTSRTRPSSCRAPRGLSQPAMHTHTCTPRHMHTQARPHASLQDALSHTNDSEPRGTSSVLTASCPPTVKTPPFGDREFPGPALWTRVGGGRAERLSKLGKMSCRAAPRTSGSWRHMGSWPRRLVKGRLRLGHTHTSKASPGGIRRASGGPRAGDPFGEARGVSVDARRGLRGSRPHGSGCPAQHPPPAHGPALGPKVVSVPPAVLATLGDHPHQDGGPAPCPGQFRTGKTAEGVGGAVGFLGMRRPRLWIPALAIESPALLMSSLV